MSAGALTITALAEGGQVTRVDIASSRPRVAGVLIGRPAEEAPALAGRLHALCGAAHTAAAESAVAAALGHPQPSPPARAILAERIGESLRSLATSFLPQEPRTLRVLRDLLAWLRSTGDAEAITAAASALGLGERPSENCWLDHIARRLHALPPINLQAPDTLGATDDAAILSALREDGASFCAQPALPGRRPEAGAFARRWRQTELSQGQIAARFKARRADLRADLALLAANRPDALGLRSVSPAPREGFACIETARGPLYHWMRASPQNVVADYAILAPTEWNFHPRGPFAAALAGAAADREMLHAVAALFDPCVGFEITMREAAHA